MQNKSVVAPKHHYSGKVHLLQPVHSAASRTSCTGSTYRATNKAASRQQYIDVNTGEQLVEGTPIRNQKPAGDYKSLHPADAKQTKAKNEQPQHREPLRIQKIRQDLKTANRISKPARAALPFCTIKYKQLKFEAEKALRAADSARLEKHNKESYAHHKRTQWQRANIKVREAVATLRISTYSDTAFVLRQAADAWHAYQIAEASLKRQEEKAADTQRTAEEAAFKLRVYEKRRPNPQ